MPSSRAAGPLAVSMGDPAGIGIDITLTAWMAREARQLPSFVLFGCPKALSERAEQLGLSVPVVEVRSPAEGAAHFESALPVMALAAGATTAGQPSPVSAGATIAAIESAVAAVLSGDAAAIVTNPIAKSVLYEAGFRYPGHTEFLAHLANQAFPQSPARAVMMLACDELRVVPLTIHIPLSAVPQSVSKASILETVRVTHEALRRDFGIAHPRIAVCGLNPHAGENGRIGREEIDVIAPALDALRVEGFLVSGPHSADTLFHAVAREAYDAAVCMYHDQALIPIKTLAFDRGVNVTLGLPFVRTSPDHGTAFGIAGSGTASPESFIAACLMARDMSARRRSVMPR